jgi:GTPase SAR1 family protein
MGDCCSIEEDNLPIKEHERDVRKKIIVIGPQSVGKTTII